MDVNYDAIRKHTSIFPVNIVEMAAELGLEISRLPLPKDVSGKLVRNGASFQIHVNLAHGENRTRFGSRARGES